MNPKQPSTLTPTTHPPLFLLSPVASKRCNDVSIQNNHVHDNGQINDADQRIGNGIMLHRSSNAAVVKNNTVHGNFDSGVALYESFDCLISDNTIYDNKSEWHRQWHPVRPEPSCLCLSREKIHI